MAGIAGGNGGCSDGKYRGIAPECNIIAVKILDREGRGNSADVLAGLQWVLDNRKRLNIRVANLSIGTSDYGSRDPLVKAVEALWDEGIVITIAAGNNGPHPGSVTSPGTSRKVITVGTDDMSVHFSGRGPTMECIVKPDIIAPGANIISCLTPTPSQNKITAAANLKIISENYIQLSGTSMSTPVVTGAVALLLQKHPSLTPDDVKYMLKKCAVSMNYPKNHQGWGRIDIEKLISEEAIHVRKPCYL